jgi:hypothetical protein
MNDKCRRLLNVLEELKKQTVPAPWLGEPKIVEEYWSIAKELLFGISTSIEQRYEIGAPVEVE